MVRGKKRSNMIKKSSKEDPLPGYRYIRSESRTYSESSSKIGLDGQEYCCRGDLFVDKREANYSSATYPTPDGQESDPSPCMNHVAVRRTFQGTEPNNSGRGSGTEESKTATSCNKYKPAPISRADDSDSRNYENGFTTIHEADTQRTLQLHQKSRGALLSWLFPRLKKKFKSVTSPKPLEAEDVSQLFKDLGICSLETLKKELVVANESRYAALAEVGEMKSSFEELKQKLVHLEAYCEELKKALKMAVQGKSAQVMDRYDMGKGINSSGNSRLSSMPVSHEVMVEGFLQIASEARLSVKQFCKTLIIHVDATNGDLVEKLNAFLRPYHLTLNSKHTRTLLYHLEALINQTLYQDFENCVFQRNGSSKILDPRQDREQNFSSFAALRNLSWNEVLKKGTKYYSEDFSRFCDQKMSCIISTLNWTSSWSEHLLQSFFGAAKCIWLLHLLAFSFAPPLSILRVEENGYFDPVYMEDVLVYRQRLQTPARIKIMVVPGFYVQDKVLRCNVMCRYK